MTEIYLLGKEDEGYGLLLPGWTIVASLTGLPSSFPALHKAVGVIVHALA